MAVDHLTCQPAEILATIFDELMIDPSPPFVVVMRLSLTCKRFYEIMQLRWNSESFGLVNLVANENQQPWWANDTYLRQLLDMHIPLPAFLQCKDYVYGHKETIFRGRYVLLSNYWSAPMGYSHAASILCCYINSGQYEEAIRLLAMDDTGTGIGEDYLE